MEDVRDFFTGLWLLPPCMAEPEPLESFGYSNRTATLWMVHRIRIPVEIYYSLGKL